MRVLGHASLKTRETELQEGSPHPQQSAVMVGVAVF